MGKMQLKYKWFDIQVLLWNRLNSPTVQVCVSCLVMCNIIFHYLLGDMYLFEFSLKPQDSALC